jgi:NADH dehydrogenase
MAVYASTPVNATQTNSAASSRSPRTVAVTGCTGFVGRHVVRELLGRGYQVRGLIRDAERARGVFGARPPEGLATVVGDVCDGQALDALVRGCDAVIHLVGIIREVRGEAADLPQTFERMHVRATKAIVDACARAGVRRYLHMSALTVGPEGKSRYQKTKWEAEQIVRRTELDWTIFRPGIIHGPDGEFMQTMAELASGEAPPYLFIPYFARARVDHRVVIGAVTYEPAMAQPVAVEDVAFAFAQAIETPGAIGEIYNLVGSERLDWREMVEFIRDTIPGTKKGLGVWYVPGNHAATLARVADRIGLGSLLPFDEGQALMATDDTVADPTKARVDLGLEPKGFRETVRGYAGMV